MPAFPPRYCSVLLIPSTVSHSAKLKKQLNFACETFPVNPAAGFQAALSHPLREFLWKFEHIIHLSASHTLPEPLPASREQPELSRATGSDEHPQKHPKRTVQNPKYSLNFTWPHFKRLWSSAVHWEAGQGQYFQEKSQNSLILSELIRKTGWGTIGKAISDTCTLLSTDKWN